MTVKEVVKLAAEALDREDLSAEADAAGDLSGELKSLVRCYNLVENEIALDHLPLRSEEILYARADEIPYTDFSRAPVRVLRVRDGAGRDLSFQTFPDRLKLRDPCAQAAVTYSYAPPQKGLGDRSEFSGRVSARMMSLGVACEFCLTNGRYQEAALWEKRFHDALRAASVLRRKLCIRSRRWQ
jgi:hypothetical protein